MTFFPQVYTCPCLKATPYKVTRNGKEKDNTLRKKMFEFLRQKTDFPHGKKTGIKTVCF